MNSIIQIILLGLLLNIFFIAISSVVVIWSILLAYINDKLTYLKIINYTKSLKHINTLQSVANLLIPYYGSVIHLKAIIIISETRLELFERIVLIEKEVDKFRIFKRKK